MVNIPLQITTLCKEVNIGILNQNKSTHWVLGAEILGSGISTIGKCKFTILQNRMVSNTYKDSIHSPVCLKQTDKTASLSQLAFWRKPCSAQAGALEMCWGLPFFPVFSIIQGKATLSVQTINFPNSRDRSYREHSNI